MLQILTSRADKRFQLIQQAAKCRCSQSAASTASEQEEDSGGNRALIVCATRMVQFYHLAKPRAQTLTLPTACRSAPLLSLDLPEPVKCYILVVMWDGTIAALYVNNESQQAAEVLWRCRMPTPDKKLRRAELRRAEASHAWMIHPDTLYTDLQLFAGCYLAGIMPWSRYY